MSTQDEFMKDLNDDMQIAEGRCVWHNAFSWEWH